MGNRRPSNFGIPSPARTRPPSPSRWTTRLTSWTRSRRRSRQRARWTSMSRTRKRRAVRPAAASWSSARVCRRPGSSSSKEPERDVPPLPPEAETAFPALASPSGERSQPELSHAAATEGKSAGSALRPPAPGAARARLLLFFSFSIFGGAGRAAGFAAGRAAAGAHSWLHGTALRFTHFLFRLPPFRHHSEGRQREHGARHVRKERRMGPL